MPIKKRSRKKTKAELHEAIGELLHTAKVRAEMLEQSGSKTQQAMASKLRSEISRAHAAFKESIGRKRR